MKYFLFPILFLFSCSDNNSARIKFLYDNVSRYGEKTDIGISVNDSLVLLETLAPNNIADDWRAKIVTVKKGKQLIRVYSKLNNVESESNLFIDRDTNIIVEYNHAPEIDTIKHDSLIEGEKSLSIWPVSFRHK